MLLAPLSSPSDTNLDTPHSRYSVSFWEFGGGGGGAVCTLHITTQHGTVSWRALSRRR